jgi:hypothetical protein
MTRNRCEPFGVAKSFENGLSRRRTLIETLSFYRCGPKLGLIGAYDSIILFGNVKCNNDLEMGYFSLKATAKCNHCISISKNKEGNLLCDI